MKEPKKLFRIVRNHSRFCMIRGLKLPLQPYGALIVNSLTLR